MPVTQENADFQKADRERRHALRVVADRYQAIREPQSQHAAQSEKGHHGLEDCLGTCLQSENAVANVSTTPGTVSGVTERGGHSEEVVSQHVA